MIGSSIEALNRGKSKDKAYAKILAGVLEARGKDVPFAKLNQSTPNTQKYKNPEPIQDSALVERIREYKAEPTNPVLVTNLWEEFIRTKITGHEISVPSLPVCDRSREELEALKVVGRGMIYNPGLSYPILGRIFPKMQSYSVKEDSPIKDEFERVGWVDIEMTVDSPNLNTTEPKLQEVLIAQGKDGQRLSTYIWGSQMSRELTGRYFDQGSTWSRLLGSRGEGRVIDADFRKGGYLDVDWHLRASYHIPFLGGRSEGAKSSNL